MNISARIWSEISCMGGMFMDLNPIKSPTWLHRKFKAL